MTLQLCSELEERRSAPQGCDSGATATARAGAAGSARLVGAVINGNTRAHATSSRHARTQAFRGDVLRRRGRPRALRPLLASACSTPTHPHERLACIAAHVEDKPRIERLSRDATINCAEADVSIAEAQGGSAGEPLARGAHAVRASHSAFSSNSHVTFGTGTCRCVRARGGQANEEISCNPVWSRSVFAAHLTLRGVGIPVVRARRAARGGVSSRGLAGRIWGYGYADSRSARS